MLGVWLIAFLVGVHLLGIPFAEQLSRLMDRLSAPRVPTSTPKRTRNETRS